MTANDHEARAAAYDSCADHLELNWTDDPLERAHGNVISDRFRKRSAYHLAIASQLRGAGK